MKFPVNVYVGGVTVSAHQLLEALAYIAGYLLYLYLRRRSNQGSELPFLQSASIVLGAVMGALIGAKGLARLESYPLYHAHIWEARAWVGGKTIVGALSGGWLGVEAVKRFFNIRNYSADIYVFPVILGIIIGRVGCFLQGLSDQTYGTATTLPWGVDFGDRVLRHPTQLYEVIFLALLAAVFYLRLIKGQVRGCLFSQFMGAYLGYRFLVEFIKPRFTVLGGLSAIQIACLFGVAYAVFRRNDDCCTRPIPQLPKPIPRRPVEPGESRFIELTTSLCAQCLEKVEAKVVEEDGVYLRKFCPEHGISNVKIADDAEYWYHCRSIDKPPTPPLRRNTSMKRGCPWDCGMCPDHEQHCCLAVVEITDQCNQNCPICYASSLPSAEHRTLDEVRMMLDAVVANEGTVGVVQLSGGEPTLHPHFFEILDEVRKRPIRHLMINTNGQRIASDAQFVRRLADYKPGIEIYLQFDSLNPEALRTIRGADYSNTRKRAIEVLSLYDISTTLVVTLEKGVNDGEVGKIIEYALSIPVIRGVTFQPVQAAGRLDGFDVNSGRLTLSEVRRKIIEQCKIFPKQDIVPVPCHTDSIAMAYAVRMDSGKVVPLSRLIDPNQLLNVAGNTICFEQDREVKAHFETLFSAGVSPGRAAETISAWCCDDSLKALGSTTSLDYRNVFRVIIMQFMDAHSMDLRSIKRACVQIVDRDGRLVPFDTYNLIYRQKRRFDIA